MAATGPRPDTWLCLGLAFVGGYGDASGFVLAKTFTGHVTGNLVLGAISIAAGDRRAILGHFSAILTFLIGVLLSGLIVRMLKASPPLPPLSIVMGIEIVLIVAACLILGTSVAHRVNLFVVCVSLALGLQNGAFSRTGGLSVHTTYLTGMITSLISSQTERYASNMLHPASAGPDPKVSLFAAIWASFVLGAWVGASLALRFHKFGILGAAVVLCIFAIRHSIIASTVRSAV